MTDAKTLHEHIAELYAEGVRPAAPYEIAWDLESLACIGLAALDTTKNINVSERMQTLLEVMGGLSRELARQLEGEARKNADLRPIA
ncbi:MAG: hypothetical protein KGN33_17280 [Paracoccaceae bacterium]|nr:hypothetical protein [Paracoccaceae bacterium]